MPLLNIFGKTGNHERKIIDLESDSYKHVAKALPTTEKNNVITFLHNTPEKKTAKKIIKEGFRFAEDLAYTTDCIKTPSDDVLYRWNMERNPYGRYTVVIQIDENLYKSLLENPKLSEKGLFPEHALSKDRYFEDEENDDWMYRLSNKFVRGVVDRKTGKFYRNRKFNPSYFDGETMERNVDRWDLKTERLTPREYTFDTAV